MDHRKSLRNASLSSSSHSQSFPRPPELLLSPLRAEVGGREDDIILVLDQHGDFPAAW